MRFSLKFELIFCTKITSLSANLPPKCFSEIAPSSQEYVYIGWQNYVSLQRIDFTPNVSLGTSENHVLAEIEFTNLHDKLTAV